MKSFRVPILSMSLLGFFLLLGLDAPPLQADFTFGEPVSLDVAIPSFFPKLNRFVHSFSSDGLEMFGSSNMGAGQGGMDLWVLKRASPQDDWGPPENLGPNVNSPNWEFTASISSDSLELYFTSNRPGGYGYADIYVSRRATRTGPWGLATNLGSKVNSSYYERLPSVSPDGLELYFASDRPGGYGGLDIYVSKRATTSDPWGDPVNLGPAVNSPFYEDATSLSPDGLLLLFGEAGYNLPRRLGGFGNGDLWMTRRASQTAPWEPAVNLGPIVNSPEFDCIPCLAPDGSALYFAWDYPDRADIPWMAPILPIVDFNGDGKVDGKDVLCMVAGWGTDDALLDIGPFAWGDGTVGLEDLTVLAGYLGKEVSDPTLVAHWALDEIEGMGVADSAGGNNGYALGSPVWQPDGGQVDGALLFDGADDFISVPAVLNPAEGPFSVLAWVKGGAPGGQVGGQVVISQTAGANWLMADAEGKLMTELKGSGRDSAPLQSQTVITDDQWHRIALVWDGSNRTLCVDGVIAGEDTQSALPSSGNGLYIGAGKGMEPGTFFSGSIDDVRIYSRAVRP